MGSYHEDSAHFHRMTARGHTMMRDAIPKTGGTDREATMHGNAALVHTHAAEMHDMAHKNPALKPAAESASHLASTVSENVRGDHSFGSDFIAFVAGIEHA